MSVTIVTEPATYTHADGPWRWALQGNQAIPGQKAQYAFVMDGSDLPVDGDSLTVAFDGREITLVFSANYSDVAGTEADLLPVPATASTGSAFSIRYALRTHPAFEAYDIDASYNSGSSHMTISFLAKQTGSRYTITTVDSSATVITGPTPPGTDDQQYDNYRVEAAVMLNDQPLIREARYPESDGIARFDFREVLRDRFPPIFPPDAIYSATEPVEFFYEKELKLQYGAVFGTPSRVARRDTTIFGYYLLRGRQLPDEALSFDVPQVLSGNYRKTLAPDQADFVLLNQDGAQRVEATATAYFADGETRTVSLPNLNTNSDFELYPVGTNLTAIVEAYTFARCEFYEIAFQYKPASEPMVDMATIRRDIDHRVDQGGMMVVGFNRQGIPGAWWMAGYRIETAERKGMLFARENSGRRNVKVLNPRDRLAYTVRTGYLSRREMYELRETLRWRRLRWIRAVELVAPQTYASFELLIYGDTVAANNGGSITLQWGDTTIDVVGPSTSFGDVFANNYWFNDLSPYLDINHPQLFNDFQVVAETYNEQGNIMTVQFTALAPGAAYNVSIPELAPIGSFNINTVTQAEAQYTAVDRIDLIVEPDTLQIIDTQADTQQAEFVAFPSDTEL